MHPEEICPNSSITLAKNFYFLNIFLQLAFTSYSISGILLTNLLVSILHFWNFQLYVISLPLSIFYHCVNRFDLITLFFALAP